jgi:hypothetical protein
MLSIPWPPTLSTPAKLLVARPTACSSDRDDAQETPLITQFEQGFESVQAHN